MLWNENFLSLSERQEIAQKIFMCARVWGGKKKQNPLIVSIKIFFIRLASFSGLFVLISHFLSSVNISTVDSVDEHNYVGKVSI